MSLLLELLEAIGAAVRDGGGTEEGALQYEEILLDEGLYLRPGRAKARQLYGTTLCPKCGRKTSRESRYCQRCGHVPAGGFR